MRLFFAGTARRCVGLAGLLFFALPVGLSVIGCGSHATPVQYCTAGDTGPVVGQVSKIILAPNFATVGESINFGQIGSSLSATSYDCKGNTVTSTGYTYASTSSFNVNRPGGPVFADINPRTGQVCGGTWNRNVGGGIPDYTTCTAPSSTPSTYIAYVTATSNGAVSNPIAVYVHPVVTGIILGTATPAANCPTATTPGVDPGTDCSLCSPATTGTAITAPVYDSVQTGCLSQAQLGQLVARVYSNGDTKPEHNITCQVGHVSFAAQTPNIATIDPATGVVTANQPGSTVITATLSNSSTATQAGFLSTCPPASINLAIPGQPGVNSVNVAINNLQPLTTSVVDTKGNPITGLALAFISTTPQTIPAGSGSVTPTYPGSADITAVCLPSSCNPSPFSEIGLFGNGKPITSNPITVNAAGTSSTVIYMGSTTSQYVEAYDFTTNQPGTLIKLPYVPNSMIINLSGSGVYLGSAQGLMSFSTANNLLGAVNQSIPGIVLSLSPDGGTLVVTDPTRNTISLVTSSGGVTSTYGGTATEAKWSPDAQTVYITTTTGEVLTHSTFTDWQTVVSAENYTDVAVTVPHIGAYFAGPSFTDGRSYCSTSTIAATGNPPPVANEFYPLADESSAMTDRIAATTDGKHILGAHAIIDSTTGRPTGEATFSDIAVTYPAIPGKQPEGPGACTTATQPVSFQSTFTTVPLTGITLVKDPTVYTPTVGNTMEITGVLPSSNSAAAFVTYTGASGLLPFYAPSSTGAGKLQFVPLSGGSTIAPIAGVFSTDDFSFYVGTSGDDLVHIISLTYPTGTTPTATDSGTLSPALPLFNGTGNAPVNLIVQRPKKSTS